MSSLNVSGQATLNNLNVMGNLNVNGITTIIDTVINNTSMNSLSVSGPSIYYSNVPCLEKRFYFILHFKNGILNTA